MLVVDLSNHAFPCHLGTYSRWITNGHVNEEYMNTVWENHGMRSLTSV